MPSSTYVCFDCRTTDRVPISRVTKKCRKCRKLAEHVYYKFKVPVRDDDHGWAELQTKVRVCNREAKARVLARLGREREKLERILSELPKAKEQKRVDVARRIRFVKKQAAEWLQW